jgi:hypothetical protein
MSKFERINARSAATPYMIEKWLKAGPVWQ